MTATLAMAVALLVGMLGWQVRPTPRGRAVRVRRSRRARRVGRGRRRPWRRAAGVDALSIASYLEALSQELRSGAALSGALVSVTPNRAMGTDAFDVVRALVCDGRPVADALSTFGAAGVHPDVALAVQALACAAAFGGPAAATLDASAAVLRERADVAADIHAQSAQARLSARVLTVVPVGFALWSAVASPRTRAILGSPIGLVSVAVGASLNVAGWWWMRRIVGPGRR